MFILSFNAKAISSRVITVRKQIKIKVTKLLFVKSMLKVYSHELDFYFQNNFL